jgi:hypothetical protein
MTDEEKIRSLVTTVERLIASNEALMTHIDNVIREIRADDALRGNERRRHGEAIAALEARVSALEGRS